ncbi:MAG: 4Fe-4S binding protein, partial [Armatimonadota bacterium]
GIRRPHVDEVRCVGCGICENNCPAGGPVAAIHVTCDGDRRSWTREQQRQWRLSNLVERESRVHGRVRGPGD